ncbi:hypothetical protein TNCV_3085821 [Trichonephila clavipes]|nr:hypothetical protein TNCV_3085821 [Trichonephila clavipes]
MASVGRCHIKANEIQSGKALIVRLSLASALSTMRVTVRFGWVSPLFEGRTSWRRSGGSHLIPFHQPYKSTYGSTTI